jgi:hypothetical protein
MRQAPEGRHNLDDYAQPNPKVNDISRPRLRAALSLKNRREARKNSGHSNANQNRLGSK